MGKDVVADAVRILRLMDPHKTVAELWDFEMQLRDLWGGQRVYIAKDLSKKKAYCLARGLAAGRPLRELTGALRLTRSTTYRVLRRRWVSSY